MGKRKRHVIGNLKKNMYVLEIKFNREYDEEIIEAIQKVPSPRLYQLTPTQPS